MVGRMFENKENEKRCIKQKIIIKEFATFTDAAIKIDLVKEKMDEIKRQLDYPEIKSPKLKNPDTAICQSGTRIYHNNLSEILEKEKRYYEKLVYYEYVLEKKNKFVSLLTEEEKAVFESIFMDGFSVRATARNLNLSKDKAFRILNKIYKKYESATLTLDNCVL